MNRIKQNLTKAFKAYTDRVIKIYNSENFNKKSLQNKGDSECKLLLKFIETNIIYLDFPKAYVDCIMHGLGYSKSSVCINKIKEEVFSFIEGKEFIEEEDE